MCHVLGKGQGGGGRGDGCQKHVVGQGGGRQLGTSYDDPWKFARNEEKPERCNGQPDYNISGLYTLNSYMLQYQSIFNEVRRLKKEHETLLDVVDGMKRENDELIARNSIEENGSNIEKAHVASLETALEEHVKAQSELYEILNLQERQRTVRFILSNYFMMAISIHASSYSVCRSNMHST